MEMDVGIGLPNTIPGTDGAALIGWAKRAEARGFSSLATIGRVIWPGYEELVALAAAAGATERIGLLSNVMIGPARNTVLLANQAASLDRLSGGRFTLGVGVGWRTDDYEAAGLDYHSRGRLLDEQLAELAAAWRGEHIGGTPKRVGPEPTRERGVPVLVGGPGDRRRPPGRRRGGRVVLAVGAGRSAVGRGAGRHVLEGHVLQGRVLEGGLGSLDPALDLAGAGPPAGPLVLAGEEDPRARGAPDRGVPKVVQRVVRD